MVKPGFKQTEIGVIPEEWEVQTLATEYDLFAGGDLNSDDYSEVRTSDFRFSIFSNSLANSGLYGYCRVPQYKGNAITITGRGDIGHCRYRENPFCAIIRLLVCQPKYEISSKFVSEYLEATKPFVFESTGVPQLTVPQIKNVLIPVPPMSEQIEVSCALSNTDNLIVCMEKLIAKKKAIKQGAMQELLTGKKRLCGFNGEWKQYIFGEIFDCIPNNAFTRAQMSVSGKVKNIHYGDLLTKYGTYIDAKSKEIPFIAKEVNLSRFADKCYLQSGDVVIADTAEDETVGKALEVVNVDCPILAGQHTLLCRPKKQFAPKFLGYYLNAACFHDQLLPYIVGTKVSSISKASIVQTVLTVPEYEEQSAIAEILSNMDLEIESLEQKLAKARQLKQGMMQQLLTGKIRLV